MSIQFREHPSMTTWAGRMSDGRIRPVSSCLLGRWGESSEQLALVRFFAWQKIKATVVDAEVFPGTTLASW
jgi:hypothetical protein